MADSKTTALAEQQKTEYVSKIEQLQKRNEELENEMRYVDYTKSEEFKKNHLTPYENAWKRATSELSEIQVNVDGEMRQASTQDLMTLVNLPLGKAREIADQVFGPFADDMMRYRTEIRDLFQKQQEALSEVREKGAAREKERLEQTERMNAERNSHITEVWKAAHDEIAKDQKVSRYVTPIEGDDESNAVLQKGFEFADKAFTVNPLDPSLSKEQRAEAVRMHVALRNRAAAFGRLTAMVSKLEANNKALEAELAKYKSTTPTTGGGIQTPATPGVKSAREEVFAALRARAK